MWCCCASCSVRVYNLLVESASKEQKPTSQRGMLERARVAKRSKSRKKRRAEERWKRNKGELMCEGGDSVSKNNGRVYARKWGDWLKKYDEKYSDSVWSSPVSRMRQLMCSTQETSGYVLPAFDRIYREGISKHYTSVVSFSPALRNQ